MNDRVPEPESPIDLVVRDLGRMAYAEAYELQRSLQRVVIDARPRLPAPGYLLLVEHDPPVITISRRASARQHLVATPEQLRAAGVEVAETDRGGDITYHGPGQLVVYPVLDLNALGLRLHSYMRFLEQVVIDVLAEFDVRGERDPQATGVWVRGKAQEWPSLGFEAPPDARPAKIAALGVRISRWVSMHGLALNVMPDLSHFNLIVPCGLAGRAVTSMKRELGEACPAMDQVKAVMVTRFEAAVRGAIP